MAKRRRKRAAVATRTKVIRVGGSSPAPIIRVAAPRAAPVKHRRRRRSGGGGRSHVGGLVGNETVQMAIGGALYGFAVKSGVVAKLPEIPVLGRTGTAAIILDYWSRHGGGRMARSAAHAAAAIAGYQLGAEGKISGDATTPGSLAGDYADGDFAEGDEYG